jgi:SOS-response transcriptional repressor LexA
MIPVYHSKAAAGSPLPILTDTWDNVRKDVSTPKAANFGIVLAGDSMEPDYPDGCMVWVEAQETLESGDIGIFALFGEAVCKKFYLKDGKCRPLSLNPRYAPIEITENAEMKIYSKVVGLAEGR